MKEQYPIPVVVIVFNRIALAEKMLHCLERLCPRQLFIISDGARASVPEEREKVEKVRALFEHVSWSCEVHRNYADKNMGCDDRIPSGLDWVFDQVKWAVILEDDCIPSPQFFRYAEDMLEKYQDESKVMMISGSNPVQRYETAYSCFFTARVYTWGWATWRRAWKYYCGNDSAWKKIQRDGTFSRIYALRTRYYVKKELNYYFKRGKCPWDYLWWISCMNVGGLCAVPRVNLITNEGFGTEATHTQIQGSYKGETYLLEFPLVYPDRVARDRNYDRYDSGLNPPWKLVKACRKLKRILYKQKNVWKNFRTLVK